MTAPAQGDIDQLSNVLDGSELEAWDYATAAIILVAAVVVGRIVRMVIRRLIDRSRADSFLGDLFGRIANYVIVAFGLVYALESLGVAIAPLLGALGIVGIALAFALQDLLENFVAGIMLQLRRPFTAGDEVELGDHEGAVTAVDARTVTIRTPDGETVRIPSAQVIKNPIVNHTQEGGRRTTLAVGVAYDTDLAHATEVALEALRGADVVRDRPEPQVFVETFGASSIDLALLFWHDPSIAARWRARHAAALAVAEAFEREGINIPFPQRVLRFAESVSVELPAVGSAHHDD